MSTDELPDGWVIQPLRDYVEPKELWNARRQPRKRIRYIELPGIDNERGVVASFSDIEADKAPSRVKKIVRAGDVIFATTRPNLKNIAIVPDARAGRLKAELLKRSVHPDVLRFCRAELLQDNYFHAVLEATKSVADKIRAKTGLTGDSAELADQALAIGKTGMPFLAFNSLRTDSEQSEQKGLLNSMKGMFGTFRNPTAHAPKVSWNMTEQDALDLLTMASFLHRRLDGAVRTPRTK